MGGTSFNAPIVMADVSVQTQINITYLNFYSPLDGLNCYSEAYDRQSCEINVGGRDMKPPNQVCPSYSTRGPILSVAH
jgi:hypothetical protein